MRPRPCGPQAHGNAANGCGGRYGRVRERSRNRAGVPGRVIRKRLSEMVLRPEQLPHLVREARIVSFAYFSPVSCDSRAIRAGRSALAARRSSSMRALASAGGKRGFRRHPCRHTYAGCSIQSAFRSRNSMSACGRNAVRKRQPHGPRTAHAESRCGVRARVREERHLAQPGMRHGRDHRISTAVDRQSWSTRRESRTFQLDILEQNPATVVAVIQQPQ